MTARLAALSTLSCLLALAVFADGPGDNIPDKVRPIPPVGMDLKQEDSTALKDSLTELRKAIDELPGRLKGKPALLELIPDVEVFHKAVLYALQMKQFYAPADVARARAQVKMGLDRARQLLDGKPTWTTATGRVIRGYRSRIDGSVQPYGLVVPASYRGDGTHKHRLDIWLHGRGEKSSEVNFIGERLGSGGLFQPPDAFVLHPYGRYCNAFKFAGEIDVLEAIEHVKKQYRVDDERVVMRGFSMGGAGCWQFAVHYPGLWCAAAPGAGFSETPDFLKTFQKEKLNPSDHERTLWRMYDCPGWARNIFNLPTVVYSGEKDSQKQAADIMEPALKNEGIAMTHIIGKNAGHSYTQQAKEEIDRRIDRLAERGRERVPARVRFATYTLRYNRSFWVQVDGLKQHWEPGTVDAALVKDGSEIELTASGVTALTLTFGPGDCPLAFARKPVVKINGLLATQVPLAGSDRSWSVSFTAVGPNDWTVGKPAEGVRKRHGLQGPIDDAFLDRFVFVRPTGKAMSERTGEWVKAEMERAIVEWRRHFRGDAIVKDDKDITDADVASGNLILWGDPSSNKVLAKVAEKMPIGWDGKGVRVGEKSSDAQTHVALMIYPNPLNPKRYVVLNSGFTFREYDYLNNARQTPKLPDYAIVDVTTKPNARYPGKVVTAGFFDENWRLRNR